MRKMSWLLAFSLAWLVIVVPAAMADELSNGEEFSNASVQGPYGFGFDGTLSGNRIAVVGQFIANGQGFLAGQRTLNTGGPVLEQSFTCLSMEHHAAFCYQITIKKVLIKRVREPVAHGRAPQLVDQSCDARGFERVDGPFLSIGGDCGDDVELEVLTGNESAITFYESLGFFPRTTVLRYQPAVVRQ